MPHTSPQIFKSVASVCDRRTLKSRAARRQLSDCRTNHRRPKPWKNSDNRRWGAWILSAEALNRRPTLLLQIDPANGAERHRVTDRSARRVAAGVALNLAGLIDLIAQSRDIQDPDTGGQTIVKIYRSEKAETEDSWSHRRIRLEPDSMDINFKFLTIDPDTVNDLRVVDEFVGIIS